jgi:hypothetical protein
MKLNILTLLKLRPAGVPETALRIEIEVRFRVRVGDMEFSEALLGLEAGGHIEKEEDEITGDRIWKLKGKRK